MHARTGRVALSCSALLGLALLGACVEEEVTAPVDDRESREEVAASEKPAPLDPGTRTQHAPELGEMVGSGPVLASGDPVGPPWEPATEDGAGMEAVEAAGLTATTDGVNDLVWRNRSTGELLVWLMEGTSRADDPTVGTVSDTDWWVVGTGDYEGSGRVDDLVWHNRSSGEIVVWLMEGRSRTAVEAVGTVGNTDWRIVGVGDFEGAGTRDDLLWRNRATGALAVWPMSGVTKTGLERLGTVGTPWWIRAVADLEEGGTPDDLVWRNPSNGGTVLWTMDGTSRTDVVRLSTVDSAWRVAATGDYGGDGFDNDLVWRHGSTGRNVLWQMNGTSRSTITELHNVSNLDWQIRTTASSARPRPLEGFIRFERPSTVREGIDPYTALDGRIEFSAVSDEHQTGVVANRLTSACLPPSDENLRLGTGLADDGSSIGRTGDAVRIDFTEPLAAGSKVTVGFFAGHGERYGLELYGQSGNLVDSTTVEIPKAGICDFMSGDPRGNTRATAVASESVSYALAGFAGSTCVTCSSIGAESVTGGLEVWVLDNVEITSGVPRELPVVSIQAPADGGVYATGSSLDLSGTGEDAEDGTLTGESLLWWASLGQSDPDSSGLGRHVDSLRLGAGSSPTWDSLPSGNHLVTLLAQDSDGLTGRKGALVRVLPQTAIRSPEQGAGFSAGDLVGLEGVAEGVDQQPLTGTSLVWTSNIDGQIGTGENVSTSSLSPGEQKVKLTATDGQGNQASDTVGFSVRTDGSLPDTALYVGHQLPFSDSVSVVDMAANTFDFTFSLPDPHAAIAFSPDGATAYFTRNTNDATDEVLVVDVATNSLTTTIAVGDLPSDIAVSNDGSKAYVTNRFSGNVSVIDLGMNAVIETIPVADQPHSLTVHPDGHTVYVAHSDSPVTMIDVATDTAKGTMGGSGQDVAVHPDGSKVYLVKWGGAVDVIDVASQSVVASMITDGTSRKIALTPDGQRAYVSNRDPGTVSVLDLTTNSYVTSVSVGSRPDDIVISPDGRAAYVANSDESLSVIEVATDTVIRTIRLIDDPTAMALLPVQ